MDRERAIWRLGDMKAAIAEIDRMLDGVSIERLQGDPIVRAALERFLEIVSEASRHVPEAWKQQHAGVPWRQVADLGNHLRHAYHRTDIAALWSIYADDLPTLARAVDAMLAAHGPGTD